jgi:epoxide hydrolase 4
VIHHLKRDKAIIIGHDWGGAIAWIFAIGLPALTERLIILNSPHPTGITRELTHNPQQQEQSAYARDFQQEGAHKRLTPESLSAWVKDSTARERYIEAFRRSDFEAMLHYYKQNYPRPPYQEMPMPVKVQAPVLQIHGLQDQFLLPASFSGCQASFSVHHTSISHSPIKRAKLFQLLLKQGVVTIIAITREYLYISLLTSSIFSIVPCDG